MTTNINLYRIFCYVAKHKTTTAAAEELFNSQPAVSNAVKQLEQNLGCSLFERSSRGMDLTEQGQFLYKNIAPAIERIERTEEQLLSMIRDSSGVIDLGYVDVAMQFFLLPYLEAFCDNNPNIKINNRHALLPEIVELIKKGKIDFAVMHNKADDDELISIPVREARDILICGAEFAPRVKEDVLTPQDLAKYHIAGHSKDCSARQFFDDYLSANGVELSPTYETPLISSVIRQVKKRFCLAFVLADYVAEDIERGDLVELPIIPPPPSRYFYLIKPEHVSSRSARMLIDFILADNHVSRLT